MVTTPSCSKLAATVYNSFSFRTVTISPSAAIRSLTSWRKRLGTKGAGFSHCRSNISGVRTRPISRTSRKPLVVINPVVAPRCSSKVLDPTVVPCSTSTTSSGPQFAAFSKLCTPDKTARSSWSGVEAHFRHHVLPSLSLKTKSVKVPPISTPIRKPVVMHHSAFIQANGLTLTGIAQQVREHDKN